MGMEWGVGSGERRGFAHKEGCDDKGIERVRIGKLLYGGEMVVEVVVVEN
jgi:hypothetical protein